MAGGGPLDIWNEWATQILVLLSLTLHVVLLLFAGIRRREASAVPTFLLWLAYLLADSTAIYALGLISLSSAPSKHQLVAFWAPFLLLHLGGPDNITAYSLEDSQLWLRHMQNLCRKKCLATTKTLSTLIGILSGTEISLPPSC
jgi:hypothetical protein